MELEERLARSEGSSTASFSPGVEASPSLPPSVTYITDAPRIATLEAENASLRVRLEAESAEAAVLRERLDDLEAKLGLLLASRSSPPSLPIANPATSSQPVFDFGDVFTTPLFNTAAPLHSVAVGTGSTDSGVRLVAREAFTRQRTLLSRPNRPTASFQWATMRPSATCTTGSLALRQTRGLAMARTKRPLTSRRSSTARRLKVVVCSRPRR